MDSLSDIFLSCLISVCLLIAFVLFVWIKTVISKALSIGTVDAQKRVQLFNTALNIYGLLMGNLVAPFGSSIIQSSTDEIVYKSFQVIVYCLTHFMMNFASVQSQTVDCLVTLLASVCKYSDLTEKKLLGAVGFMSTGYFFTILCLVYDEIYLFLLVVMDYLQFLLLLWALRDQFVEETQSCMKDHRLRIISTDVTVKLLIGLHFVKEIKPKPIFILVVYFVIHLIHFIWFVKAEKAAVEMENARQSQGYQQLSHAVSYKG